MAEIKSYLSVTDLKVWHLKKTELDFQITMSKMLNQEF